MPEKDPLFKLCPIPSMSKVILKGAVGERILQLGFGSFEPEA